MHSEQLKSLSNYLDRRGIFEMQQIVLNYFTATATNVTKCTVNCGMMYTRAQSILFVHIHTGEGQTFLQIAQTTYSQKFSHRLQEDLATTKVFHQEQYALHIILPVGIQCDIISLTISVNEHNIHKISICSDNAYFLGGHFNGLARLFIYMQCNDAVVNRTKHRTYLSSRTMQHQLVVQYKKL